MGDIQQEKVNNNYVWKELDRELIIDFLQNFKVYIQDEFGIQQICRSILYGSMPEKSIRSGISPSIVVIPRTKSILSMDISIYPEERKVSGDGDYYEVQNRQVSSGVAESVAFSEEDKGLGSKRKEIRGKMKRPLLMLHLLEAKEREMAQPEYCLAAFGVSFPGGITSANKTIKLKINSVLHR